MARPPSYVSGSATSLSDFKQLALLGEGAYSAVYKVLRLADNETYALKKVKLPSLSDKEKQNALNEVRLLASVQHENVVAYKEAFWDEKTRCLCIIQECADAGDLLQQINKCKQERAYLREADIWRYLEGMCQGLKALHDLRILHRDMKCANVFLSANRAGTIAKLGDFNVSKVAKRGLCMTQTGTPYYASPEVWRDMPYDAKSDMWSLGCVLYEMVALRPPFRAEDMEGLYRKVVRGQYPRIPAHYSQDLADVIAALLQVHPRNRPSVDELLQMPQMMRHSNGIVTDTKYSASELLSTIKLPKNAIDLSGCLPKARYGLPEVQEESESFRQETPGSSRARTHSATRRLASGNGSATGGTDTQGLPPLPPRGGRGAAPDSASKGGRQEELEGDSLDAYLQLRRNRPEAGQDYSMSRVAESDAGSVAPSQGAASRQPRLPAVGESRGQSTVNPHYGAGGGGGGGAASQQAPQAQRSRRPMSIYARQQYSAVEQPPQPREAREPREAEQPKETTGSGPRKRRSLIPRLF
eukprot:TRINITY_DN44513_c0_g1_i1.p1 TRINITY_DN44513_c0_g1~~TRINITY_DN44513_c0_g1_i1.p1  ORF type:complete len:527 (-),score=94.07 TRINITY_DN44513_c0_g1_i1:59-1639(-)